jgi:lipopolysaccharide transport system ATP-binding protein
MSDIAIRVEGLGKRYRIGRQERYRTLRDTLVEGAQRTVRTIRGWLSRDGRREPDEQTIWALKDVSFEVKRGEVLGIIGRNGAGKSTLLKILSRVTEPTEGWAEVRGRVGSLLEVGTGFHPELTGRENIYLNGAILGMKRAEIARKFDEIVAFAEVEKFIDTPVKHYSSGMYLRLAFAVAAHLEPEILLVDEVLAVGDAAFQKKCLGKMGEVAGEGRTVLFVSHNMAAVQVLCSKAVVLHKGQVVYGGGAEGAVAFYLDSFVRSEVDPGSFAEQCSGPVRICSCRARSLGGPMRSNSCLVPGYDGAIEIMLDSENTLRRFSAGFSIRTANDVVLTELNSDELGVDLGALPRGRSLLVITLPRVPYTPGTYALTVWLRDCARNFLCRVKDIRLDVCQAPIYGTSCVDHRFGLVAVPGVSMRLELPAPDLD